MLRFEHESITTDYAAIILCFNLTRSYRHYAVINDAAHLEVLQVTVLDVCCQAASGTAVGARGRDQPLHRQGLGQHLGLHLESHRASTGVIWCSD